MWTQSVRKRPKAFASVRKRSQAFASVRKRSQAFASVRKRPQASASVRKRPQASAEGRTCRRNENRRETQDCHHFCHHFWTRVASLRLERVNRHGDRGARPAFSRLKNVNRHRDRSGPGRETQNCRHFLTCLASSRLKSVNRHRDRSGPGREAQNWRHFWTPFGLVLRLRVSNVSTVTGIGGGSDSAGATPAAKPGRKYNALAQSLLTRARLQMCLPNAVGFRAQTSLTREHSWHSAYLSRGGSSRQQCPLMRNKHGLPTGCWRVLVLANGLLL